MIAWIVGGAVALYFLNISATGINLRYEVTAVRFSGMQGINPMFVITMRFVNPRRQPMTLNSVFLEVFTPQNAKIGEITEPALNRVIEPSGQTNIDFQFVINALGAGQTALSIIKTRKLPSPLKFVGNIRVNEILLPVDYNYSLLNQVG